MYKKSLSLLTLESSYRCEDYWKERLTAERAEMLAQSKLHWAKIAYGYWLCVYLINKKIHVVLNNCGRFGCGLEPSSIFSQVYLWAACEKCFTLTFEEDIYFFLVPKLILWKHCVGMVARYMILSVSDM